MTSTFIHDPQSTLDYAQDWSRWLSADEHITSHLVTATGTAELLQSTEAAGIVTVWVAGGTPGTTSTVTIHIVTNQGRQDDRSMRLQIRNR